MPTRASGGTPGPESPQRRRRADGARPVASGTGGVGGGTLPRAVDSFLGRDADMRGIDELFERGRLVTITGAPGMGKTRLATEFGRASLQRYRGKIWLVPLAPLTSFDRVAPALAAALGVDDHAGTDIVEAMTTRIGDERLLLVLDNCEHLLEASAHLAATLIDSCPNLMVLATSQERLAVTGEQVWPLSGLAVPDPTEGDLDVASAAASPAVALFVDRARSIRPGFEVDTANVTAVVDACRRLDGIPLAIELAAAWVKVLGPAEIARRLDDRFAFLIGGSRQAQPRHQTLRAAVDWSYDLLGEPEQALLRRLSIFAGGARLDAVEEVCAGDGIGIDDCLSLLHTLVERSLVVTTTGTDDTTRFGLLETIRFYGRDRLVEAGEASTTASRHLTWCIELAEEAERHLTGPGQTEWLARLDADHDNLRAALARALDQGPTDQALRLAGSLALFWRIRGHFREGFDWLGHSVDAGENAPVALRAKGRWGYALLAAVVGEWSYSGGSAQVSLDLYEQLADRSGTARALLLLGTVPRPANTPTGIDHLQRAIALSRQVDDKWCLAYALAVCGATFRDMGEAMARPMLEEAVTVASDLGDPECLRYARISLGGVLLADGEISAARQLLEATLSGESGINPYERAVVQAALARAAITRGDFATADGLLDAAAADIHRSRSAEVWIDILCLRGQLQVAAGDVDAAGATYEQSRDFARTANFIAPATDLGVGEVAAAQGDYARATQVFEEVREAAESRGNRRSIARALHGLACVALATGEDGRAADRAQRASELRAAVGDRIGLADSLETHAYAEARLGRAAKAVRLLAAVDADRQNGGYVALPPPILDREAVVAAAREFLGDEAFAAAWADGAATTPSDAVASLATRGSPRRDRPASGVASLTDRELAVARLLLEGLTNPEIASRLFVSPYTIKSHVRRAFVKLGIHSRRELRDRFRETGL